MLPDVLVADVTALRHRNAAEAYEEAGCRRCPAEQVAESAIDQGVTQHDQC
jgi:hypothetical protein